VRFFELLSFDGLTFQEKAYLTRKRKKQKQEKSHQNGHGNHWSGYKPSGGTKDGSLLQNRDEDLEPRPLLGVGAESSYSQQTTIPEGGAPGGQSTPARPWQAHERNNNFYDQSGGAAAHQSQNETDHQVQDRVNQGYNRENQGYNRPTGFSYTQGNFGNQRPAAGPPPVPRPRTNNTPPQERSYNSYY